MSRIHDQPDPSVIRKTARSWQPSSRLLDPKNSEAPDITHRSLVDNMLTEAVTSVTSLIDRIEELCPSLPTSVPKGTEEDKIRHVLNHIKGPDPDDPGSTFNRRMDILFGEDCRDDNGRLHHVRRGPWGMKLVVQYFRSIKWATGCVPFTMASIKLTRIVTEMEHLCLNASDVTASAPQTGQASSSKSAGSKRKSAEALSDTEDTPTPKKSKNSSTRNGSVTIEDVDEDDEFDEELSPAARNAQKSKVGDQPSEGDSGTEDEGATTRKKPGAPGSRLGPTRTTKLADRRRNKKKASKGSGSDPTAVGANGMLVDVETPALVEAKKSPTADVQHFSGKPFMSIGQSGIQKPHRKCRLCGDLTVSDPSTFRRHMAKYHNPEYQKWTEENKFESRLEADAAARKLAVLDAATKKARLHQATLDPHLRDKPERVAPYSDDLFRDAALEWLIATDQLIRALTHPKFKVMIDIAARATEGVQIPGRNSTRKEIVNLFHAQMDRLRIRLRSNAVTGQIHITCDAWQAGNTDGYFVVTGHWMEETSPGIWVLQEALLGFTRLNNAHHGVRLGQALYKIVNRLGLEGRIGYVTCDNAANNGTMLTEFARQVLQATGVKWDPIERRINCLAHVINLATQKLISAYSKSPHFNAHDPTAHVPNTSELDRDEIGLLRAIAVKERSSAKRKELFKTIQLRTTADPAVTAKQMVLDMKVRWSSTYAMLNRGYDLRRDVDTFVFEISRDETGEKRKKLAELQLSDDEWNRVDSFLYLLASAEKCQQAFSADYRSTLHLAIPALESLHAVWTKRSDDPEFSRFHNALGQALAKVDEYYNKTSNSNSYMFAMVLDPRKKLSHFKKHWPAGLQDAALADMEETFKQRYYEIQNTATTTSTAAPATRKPKASNARARRELTPEEEDDSALAATHLDTSQPWKDEFTAFLAVCETVPAGMSTIEWWGRNYQHYPVWGSLARDYLAIMASSVSSERAFSSAGITISKRRNRLRGDIVEALQCLKCLIRRDLLFRAPAVFDFEAEEELDEEDAAEVDDGEEGWDCFLDDAADNYEPDYEMDD